MSKVKAKLNLCDADLSKPIIMNKLKGFLWKGSLIFFLLLISPFITFAFFRWIFTGKFKMPTITESKYTKWIMDWQNKLDEHLA